MVARIWHGKTKKVDSDEYLQFLKERAIPDYRSVPGNKAAYIMRHDVGSETHFQCLTFWESYDVIKKFAGEDIRKAKYYPEDKAYLLEFEPEVIHYEVFSE